MKRLLILVFLVAASALAAHAQSGTTLVTGVVKDLNNQAYSNCQMSANYVASPTATTVPLINGSTFPPVVPVFRCDGNGNFSATVIDNNLVSDGHTGTQTGQWQFQTCSAPGKYPGPPYCFPLTLVITGTTMDISIQMQAASVLLPASGGGGTGNLIGVGIPTPGQVGIFTDATHIQGVSATGSGVPVESTSPTISNPFFVGSPYTDSRSTGTICDNTTNSSTSVNNLVNGLPAAGGGSVYGCDSVLWTPPASYTNASIWQTLLLGGQATVKATLHLPYATELACENPRLHSAIVPFSDTPTCPVVDSPTSISPVILSDQGLNTISRVTVQPGFTGIGVQMSGSQTWLNDVWAQANNDTATPFVVRGGFGYHWRGGGAESADSGTGQPSILFDTPASGPEACNFIRLVSMQSTFFNNKGIHFTTECLTPTSPVNGIWLDHPFYENATESLVNFDLTNNSASGFEVYSPFISDAAMGAVGAVYSLTRSGNANAFGPSLTTMPSGQVFDLPPNDLHTMQAGAIVLGCNAPGQGANGCRTGLYGINNTLYLQVNTAGALSTFNGSGSGASMAAGGGLVVPIQPPFISVTPSTSGGSLATGTYYYMVVPVDSLGNEGLPSADWTAAVTGPTGSVSVALPFPNTYLGSISATTFHIYRDTKPLERSNGATYFTSTLASPFVDTGGAGTGGLPTQLTPRPDLEAGTTFLNPIGPSYSGMSGCFGFGTQSCSGMAGDVTIAHNLTVTGTCTGGCSSAFTGGLGTSYQDVPEIAPPGNPTGINDRLFLNNSTHVLNCLTSSGGNCLTSGGTITGATFTGGIVSVSGSPTLSFSVAGTSGGIPCFTSTTNWASSALFNVNRVLLGGGAGACPTQTANDATATHVLINSTPPAFGAITGAMLPAINLATSGGGGVTGSLPFAQVSGTLSTAQTPLTTANDLMSVSGGGALNRVATGGIHTLLHGTNLWSAIDLAADVTGALPVSGMNFNGNMIPSAVNTVTLGSTAVPFVNLFLGTVANQSAGFVTSGLSANRLFTFPDKAGTFAMTSDVSAPAFMSSAAANDYPCWNGSALIDCTPGVPANTQSSSTYTIVTGDRGNWVKRTNTSAGTDTLPQAGTTGFANAFFFTYSIFGTAAATLAPTTSTITVNGASGSTLPLNAGDTAFVESDNTNYNAVVVRGNMPQAFSKLLTCSAALEGATAAVTDSTTNTWGATITGGSTNHVHAYCDGTNWTVEGK